MNKRRKERKKKRKQTNKQTRKEQKVRFRLKGTWMKIENELKLG